MRVVSKSIRSAVEESVFLVAVSDQLQRKLSVGRSLYERDLQRLVL